MNEFAFRLKKATIGGMQQSMAKTLSGNPLQSVGIGTDEKEIRVVFMNLKDYVMKNKAQVIDLIMSDEYAPTAGVGSKYASLDRYNNDTATLMSAVIMILNTYFSQPKVAGKSIGAVMDSEGMGDPLSGYAFGDYLNRLYGVRGFEILNDEDYIQR